MTFNNCVRNLDCAALGAYKSLRNTVVPVGASVSIAITDSAIRACVIHSAGHTCDLCLDGPERRPVRYGVEASWALRLHGEDTTFDAVAYGKSGGAARVAVFVHGGSADRCAGFFAQSRTHLLRSAGCWSSIPS